ncbi:DUF262 domain-containing protein [Cellulosimicrobium sp. TH-20]|uniref:DUF262 domain-containing protein n=1 Tax=Cellulosimicrobium sp. TH-20 TaxID=1980001 RepID=UPI00119FE0C4|nr:DUF262 domain-containing protein [Cellulosimicrobium sp. TH-20]
MGFQTPQYKITTLLAWAAQGKVQLPDFQRPYKWDDDRIRELLVTILRGHPMGVIMTLETGNDQVRFKPKPLTGVDGGVGDPEYLLLDGQQRMTSMFQALSGNGVVDTLDARKKKLRRRYFIDIEKSLGSPADQDESVLSLPEDGKVKKNFDREIVLDVSTTELQQRHGLMPMVEVFGPNPMGWLFGYTSAVEEQRAERQKHLEVFHQRVLNPMSNYEIPAIELDRSTTKEAVATVFEKVNTGGLALDVFELLTSTFAGDASYYVKHGTDFRLAEDWALTEAVLAKHPVISGLRRTDFLQAVTLLATHQRHTDDIDAGKKRPAATSARREDVLRLSLDDYLAWADQVRAALAWVAGFFREQHIHAPSFLPYRTQIVPLAVLRVLLGEDIDAHPVLARVRQWYWCGVLGELYGGSIETRFARDVEQVPAWARAALDGAPAEEPYSVSGAGFRESRLHSLHTRNSAAYKGLYALLMTNHVKDWQYDKQIDFASYSDLQVDIHHIFPTAYASRQGFVGGVQDSIVNKTPLAKKTNIFLSGRSPADYLPALESKAGLTTEALDDILRVHLIDPELLRKADFESFIRARRGALVDLVEKAMGKQVARDVVDDSGAEDADAFEPEPADTEDGEDEYLSESDTTL